MTWSLALAPFLPWIIEVAPRECECGGGGDMMQREERQQMGPVIKGNDGEG